MYHSVRVATCKSTLNLIILAPFVEIVKCNTQFGILKPQGHMDIHAIAFPKFQNNLLSMCMLSEQFGMIRVIKSYAWVQWARA